MADSELQLTYFPAAGRAELTRLICAAGGLKVAEAVQLANGETKDMYMSPSGVPLLRHGDLRMSQSTAIEGYVASIAPRFSGLTPQQQAVDAMWACIKEDVLAGLYKPLFATAKMDPERAKEEITAVFDKWLTLIEAKLPAEGFIQGQPFPTVADLAVVNITTAAMPCKAAAKLAGYDIGKFAKVAALSERTAQAEGVAEYLASSKTMSAGA